MKENKQDIVKEENNEAKSGSLNVIIACAVIVVVGICAAVLFGGKLTKKPEAPNQAPVIPANQYNEMYVDIYGITLQNMADAEGLTLKEYIEKYQLPSDMPGDTNSNAVENMIPIGLKVKELGPYLDGMKKTFGINPNVSNFELYKVMNGLPAEVTEDTPVGEAKGMGQMKYIVKDEAELEEYKEKYGLGDDVTMDTYYKDVRNDIDLSKKEKFEKQMSTQKEAE